MKYEQHLVTDQAIRHRSQTLLPSSFFRAFTLLEIVIALTIIAILVAATVPSFRGLQSEQIAREPVAGLARLAKEARLHAMKEKRPYQIAFTSKGFAATRYFSPYLQAAQLDKFLQQTQLDEQAEEPKPAPLEASTAAAPPGTLPVPAFKEWTQSYNLPAGTTCRVQFWHETNPTDIAGDLVKLWVFQPSGMCPPATVKMERESATFEVAFSALTADIIREISDVK